MSQVKFLAGLKSDLSSKLGTSSLIPGALYFCTDEKKIFKATANNAFEAVNEEVCYGELPAVENAFPGKLYLRQADMTLHVLNKDGDDFKQLSAPADALVPDNVSHDLEADDKKLLASKAAVKAGIKAVADNLAKEITNRGTAEAQLLQDAKDYADNKDAALKADLQNEIDADVKVERERAELAEQGLVGRLDKIEGEGEGSITAAVKAEADRAVAKEEELAQAIANEASRAEVAELALEKRIDALTGNGEGSVAGQIEVVQKDLDAVKEVLGKPAVAGDENGEGAEDATGIFADLDAEISRAKNEEARIEGLLNGEIDRAKAAEQANASAIVQEVTDRQNAVKGVQEQLDALKGESGSIATDIAAAVAGEAALRDAEDKKLQAAIDKLNGTADAEGSVAKAVKDAVDAEALARTNADNVLDKRLQAVEESIGDGGDLEKRVDAAEDAINTLKGVDTVEGSVAKVVKDAVAAEALARTNADNVLDERLQAVEESIGDGGELEKRVAANEAKLAGLEKETVQASIDQAEADAKAHAEQKIAELVDSAPEDLNTLNELADAIKAHEDVYKAYVGTVTSDIATAKQEAIDAAVAKDATLKTELQKEIDDDVAAEKALREAEEAKIRGEFAYADTALHTTISAEIDADVEVEKLRAEAAESKLTQDLAQEIQNRKDAVKDVQDQLNALTGTGAGSIAEKVQAVQNALDIFKGEQTNKDAAQDNALTNAIAKEVEDRNDAIADAVEAEEDRAKGEEAAIRGEMATEAARVNNKIADDIKTESDLRIAEETAIRGELASEAAAIRGELASETSAREAADSALNTRLLAVEGSIGDGGALEARVATVEAKAEENANAIAQEAEDRNTAVNAEKDRAMGVEAGLRTDVDSKVAQSAYDEKVAALEKADTDNLAAAAADATTKANNALDAAKEYADDAAADAQEAAEANAAADAATKANAAQAAAEATAAADATAKADAAKAYTDSALTWGSF